MGRKVKLDRKTAAVLVVDVQDRLTPAMPRGDARARREVRARDHRRGEGARAARARDRAVSEGARADAARSSAELLPSPPLEKTHFSCGADPAFAAALEATGRRQVIIAGMETHVCVFQTVRDLVAMGYEVHVCADAVSSRTEEHRRVGLELCREAGAIAHHRGDGHLRPAPRAATAEFRKVAPLVK